VILYRKTGFDHARLPAASITAARTQGELLSRSSGTSPRVRLSPWTAVSSATGTIVLIVRFPNPSYRLKTGQFARVEANIGAKLPRVLVPQQSVVQTLDVSSVWVIRPDSTAEYRKVTPGETFGGMWAIESGLEPGETVAVTGLQKLRQGMRVVPVKK
jgi:RND family efflux transporter MFP subunit